MSKKGKTSHYKERCEVIAAMLLVFSPILLQLQIDLTLATFQGLTVFVSIAIEVLLSGNSDTILNWLVLRKWFMRHFEKQIDPKFSNEFEQTKKKYGISNDDIDNSAPREMRERIDEYASRGIMYAGGAVVFLSYFPAYILSLILLSAPTTTITETMRLVALIFFVLSLLLAYSSGRKALVQRHKLISCRNAVLKEMVRKRKIRKRQSAGDRK